MKLLYEASNTIEAHMILNLLEQSGLSARIDGEYLQGAFGELPITGVIRVMVEENNYADANEIIRKWDARQPKEETQAQTVKQKSSFNAGFLGFILGVVVMAVYYNTPVTKDGVDYNGDGLLDEKWTFVNHRLSKAEIDRNSDGEIDLIYIYDRMGLVESSSSDEDFDGVFETESYYKFGNPVWQKSDTTGDGFKDYRTDFKYGRIYTITFFDSVTKKPIKVQTFGPIKLKRAEIDTTGDGTLDTLYEYNAIEEIAHESSNAKKSTP